MIESTLFETHFDMIPFGIYVVDVATYEIIFVNRYFKERFGDFTGGACYQSFQLLDRPCAHCKIRDLVSKDNRPSARTYVYEHFNEVDNCWYQMHEKAMSWPDGRVAKYAIAVDISELKEMQNRLAEAHAELALKNKELTRQNELLQENIQLREDVERITRHDLRTPLGAVVTLPRLLMDEHELPESTVQGLKMMEESGLQMLNFINRSLDLYRMEAGAYEYAPTPMDLAALIRRVAGDLGALLRARQSRFDMTLDGKTLDEASRLDFSGEELLLYTVLANLLSNAVEASPEGDPVRLEVLSGPEVVLNISNQGEVPEAIRERFFEKYVTSGKMGGTGLGTYSALLAVQVHGGSIELDSSQPGRTTATVRLPNTIHTA
ncbi:MAG: ATP-binding protein [Desulfovibrionaceae bacterium]